ncbi:MAG: hypothetical protein DWQ02_07835, partial [Bacteroidetes bacterium]
MKTKENNLSPHDEFFKAVFSRKDIAFDFIREFLPKPLWEQLDLSKLTIANTSYVDIQLREFFSDIVYTCPSIDSEVVITFLWEHKSSPPKYPTLQLNRYM